MEWSGDSGRTWTRFGFEWDAWAGECTKTTPATDAAGNIQPDEVPFNKEGYLLNQPVPHPIRVVQGIWPAALHAVAAKRQSWPSFGLSR